MIEILELMFRPPAILWIDETTERPVHWWAAEETFAEGFVLEIRKSSKRSIEFYFAPRVTLRKKSIWQVESHTGSGVLATLDRRRGTLVVTHGQERLELHQYVVLKAMAARYLELTS